MDAAGGYYLARTISADVYSGRSLARLMALIGVINGIAPASAPVIGGVTADHWGWKGVFTHTPHTPSTHSGRQLGQAVIAVHGI
ncbi:MAG: hypothetical protein K2H99_01435 [Paramuribaculum sp.]|nr:hypothetical protein [Paramuribaculum sp.]